MSFRTHILGMAAAILVAIGSFGGTRASAQVMLSFSGGNGTEVTITWSTPIVYTLTSSTAISGKNPIFVFQSIANSQSIFQTSGAVGGVAPTYTSTGAGSTDGTQTINTFAAPNTFNTVTAGDVVFYATTDTANTLLTAGDVITLSAGSLRYTGSPNSSAGYNGALPANGYYNTFITDGANTYAANLGAGSAIPEPATSAALAGLGVFMVSAWRRRRALKAPALCSAASVQVS